MSLSIRPATAADIPQILKFIHQLAIYEKEPDAAVATAEDLLRDGFGAHPLFYVLLANWNEQPAGFAFYLFNYSTWLGKPGLYLEDLFVMPEYRGHGIGKQLLVELAKIAQAKGCGRMQWQVLDWNTPAIEFYESLGAFPLTEWETYRLVGEGIASLAQLNASHQTEM
jgi:GNAT superfamily N-acetyltransferase